MVAFGLVQEEHAFIRGVAMEPSALSLTPTFTLFKDAQLTPWTRYEGPVGLELQVGLWEVRWAEVGTRRRLATPSS